MQERGPGYFMRTKLDMQRISQARLVRESRGKLQRAKCEVDRLVAIDASPQKVAEAKAEVDKLTVEAGKAEAELQKIVVRAQERILEQEAIVADKPAGAVVIAKDGFAAGNEFAEDFDDSGPGDDVADGVLADDPDDFGDTDDASDPNDHDDPTDDLT